jgi:putative NIF3 family GTP cyclohydrolase 1 type 2
MDAMPSQTKDTYITGVEAPRKKVGLAIYRQINKRWDFKHEDGLRHEGDEQTWEKMREEFLLKAVPAGIPDPSNGKQFLAKVETFFRCGFTAPFVECLARRENQYWHADTREKVAKLERMFRKVAEWNASWEQMLSRFCLDAICYHSPKCFGCDSGCQYPIRFADFEKDPGQWQLDIVRCFKFGFNVQFVEDIAKTQHKLWTQQMRFSAQQLEKEYHKPALVQKYNEGKSTQTITGEMLDETGLKLS